MKFTLTLLDSDIQIRKAILDNLATEINRVLDKSIVKIRDEIIAVLLESLKQEPEYNALKNGKLRADFGISDISTVDDIVDKLANTTQVNKKPVTIINSGLTGGLEITAIESDTISGLINDTSAWVQDDIRGYGLPWLEWLLLQGGSVIVKGYSVRYGSYPRSRSGDAIMVESQGSWRVPAEFAGTVRNNWTTRAIDRIDGKIINIIQTNIERNI